MYTTGRVRGRVHVPCIRLSTGRVQAVYMARTRPCIGGVHVCMCTRLRTRPWTGLVGACRRPCTFRVQRRGPCTRLVRSVLLRFSLRKTPFMPNHTATNPLHSKRARTTSAPGAALQRTTVSRTMLIIGWMERWATCLFSTNYGTKIILTYMWCKQSQMRMNAYPLCVKKQFSLPLFSPIYIYIC